MRYGFLATYPDGTMDEFLYHYNSDEEAKADLAGVLNEVTPGAVSITITGDNGWTVTLSRKE